MKLTRRQEEFIEKLIDLSQEVDGPIHYSVLAERLGVSPFTAYDMLRLLEEKGYVTSEYHVSASKSGPGRAVRLFCPVQKPEKTIAERFGTLPHSQAELKQLIVDQVRAGELDGELLPDELLARIPPDGPDHIRYCLEVMMIIALRLRRHAGREKFLTYLPATLPVNGRPSPAKLSLLGGFALGILAQEETADREWSQMLLEHVVQYQEVVGRLSPDECRHLAHDLRTIFAPLAAVSQ